MHPPYSQEIVTVNRECDATEIPSGRQVILYPGTEVRIVQTVGGSFTVMTHQGITVSVAGKEADALGKEIPQEFKKMEELRNNPNLEDAVWGALKTCYDPEIPHNIVDLGLIYECKIEDNPEDLKKVSVKMTLTAPGCGMGDWLKQDVQTKLKSIPRVGEVKVDMVFDPPWTPQKMQPALRRTLNL